MKCLNQFVQNFPFLIETELMGMFSCDPFHWFIHTYASEASLLKNTVIAAIMRPLWYTFESSLQVYLRSSIEGAEDSYDGRYDSDGEEKSLDTFVIQVTYHFH